MSTAFLRTSTRFVLTLLLGVSSLCGQPALPGVPSSDSQPPVSTPTPARKALEPSDVPIRQKLLDGAETDLADRRTRLLSVEATPVTTGEDPLAPLRQVLEEAAKTLVQRRNALQQLAADFQAQETSQNELVRSQAELENVTQSGPADPPPYTFSQLERAREDLAQHEERGIQLPLQVKLAAEAETQAAAALTAQEQERRRLKESLDTASPLDAERFLVAEQRSKLAAERLAHQRLQHEQLRQSIETHGVAQSTLRERLRWIQQSATFRKEDLEAKVSDLTKDRERLTQRNTEVQAKHGKHLESWAKARERLQRDPAAPANKPAERAAQAEVEASQSLQGALARWSEWSAVRQTVWERRYVLATDPPERAELGTWSEETGSELEKAEREERLVQVSSAVLRRELLAVQERVQADTTGPELRAYRSLRNALDRAMATQDEHLGRLLKLQSDLRKLSAELAPLYRAWSLSDWVQWGWQGLVAIWNFELIHDDDRAVTLGKIFIALVLLGLGFLFSRRASQSLGNVLQQRFRVEEGTAAGFQSLAFYAMLVGFTLFGLQVAGVPLTLFAFLGGALAIGLGFGSQNILNNFISGLILLIERPIRVGDLVDIQGVQGHVHSIGLRCTRVRTYTNVDLLIPNSSFLENQVTNWTLGDARARIQVAVGVAYGTSCRKVEALLLESLEGVNQVLQDPAPFVTFNDFGASSLDFEVHFWVRFGRSVSRSALTSKIRFRIDELFAANDIEIPFVQRDLHFKPGAPIRVVVEEAKSEE